MLYLHHNIWCSLLQSVTIQGASALTVDHHRPWARISSACPVAMSMNDAKWKSIFCSRYSNAQWVNISPNTKLHHHKLHHYYNLIPHLLGQKSYKHMFMCCITGVIIWYAVYDLASLNILSIFTGWIKQSTGNIKVIINIVDFWQDTSIRCLIWLLSRNDSWKWLCNWYINYVKH